MESCPVARGLAFAVPWAFAARTRPKPRRRVGPGLLARLGPLSTFAMRACSSSTRGPSQRNRCACMCLQQTQHKNAKNNERTGFRDARAQPTSNSKYAQPLRLLFTRS